MPNESAEMVSRFHHHLDVCEQCRKHPFNLCATGATLLAAAARTLEPFRV